MDLLDSAGNSAQCYEATWMGGEFGGAWIHAYVWMSSSAALLKLTMLVIPYVLSHSVVSDSLQSHGL